MSDKNDYRKQAPEPHPDWFWSMSGGIDSTAAFLVTKDIAENYSKRPIMVYFDTTVGLPANRIYLEELADRYGVQLWSIRTEENFDQWVSDHGAPGPGAHGQVRNRLKNRQRTKLNTLADHPIHIIGLRAQESDNRAQLSKTRSKPRSHDVYPVHRLSKRECVRIILDHDCPIHPGWLWNHFTDCGCLAHGDPSELDAIANKFPWFAQRMREIEEAYDGDGDGDESLKNTLGWGGLSPNEQDAVEHGHQQASICGQSCGRRTVDDPIENALQARINGASPQEAISILDPTDPDENHQSRSQSSPEQIDLEYASSDP